MAREDQLLAVAAKLKREARRKKQLEEQLELPGNGDLAVTKHFLEVEGVNIPDLEIRHAIATYDLSRTSESQLESGLKTLAETRARNEDLLKLKN